MCSRMNQYILALCNLLEVAPAPVSKLRASSWPTKRNQLQLNSFEWVQPRRLCSLNKRISKWQVWMLRLADATCRACCWAFGNDSLRLNRNAAHFSPPYNLRIKSCCGVGLQTLQMKLFWQILQITFLASCHLQCLRLQRLDTLKCATFSTSFILKCVT